MGLLLPQEILWADKDGTNSWVHFCLCSVMASYGAYYYSGTRPETRDARSDIPARKEENKYTERPKTPAAYTRRRSITPPDLDRRPGYDIERPKNPGYVDERLTTSYGERPMTSYVPPQTATPYTPPPNRPPERNRAASPAMSLLTELSEPSEAIKPNCTTVDFYTYAKCIERY